MARFPDSRIVRGFAVFPDGAVTPPSDIGWRTPLAAYSGGTVWALHPLPVAAGASVRLSGGEL